MKKLSVLLAFLLFSLSTLAQVQPGSLMPVVRQQFLDSNAHPLAGGKIHTYIAGTTTPLATYTDFTLTIQNQNPVILDGSGEAVIWLSATSYKFCVADQFDVQQYCVDNVSNPGALAFSQAVLLNPPGRANQTVVGPLSADYFTGVLPHTTSPGVRVAILDPSTVLDSASNPPTLVTISPATPGDVINIPDPGAAVSNVVLSSGHGSTNSLDCTQAGLTCYRTANIYFEGAACNNTTPSLGWDTFGTNSPTAICVTGTNIQKGVMGMPAAATLIQQNSGTGSGAGIGVVAYPAATTAANLLTVSVVVDTSRTVSGCTDGTNAYTQAAHSVNATITSDIWYFNGSSTSMPAATNLTCTFSGAGNSALRWKEYSGILTAGALDVTATNQGTGTAVTTGTTGGTSQNTELVIIAEGSAGAPSVTVGNGFTLHPAVSQSTNVTIADAGKIQQAPAPQSGTFTLTSSQVWAASVATFKVNVAGSTTAQRQFAIPTFYNGLQATSAYVKWQVPNAPTGVVSPSVTASIGCALDGFTDDNAFNTGVAASPVIPTSSANVLQTTTLTPLINTGCAAGGLMHLKISRNRYDANDTVESWLYINGVTLTFGISQ